MDGALATTEVLLIDCQTTGASPVRGHLLEVAWAKTRASELDLNVGAEERVPPTSMLVTLPEGAILSRRITALTGIDRAALETSRDPARVWEALLAVVESMRPGWSEGDTVPTVIHFARFEEPFLRALHADHGPTGSPFPFELICTHALAQVLFPDLPRRGLKALAGFFGHVMTEHKRAAAHVVATAVVWAELIDMLERETGIVSFEAMRDWLEKGPAVSRATAQAPPGRRSFPMDRSRRLGLPSRPGIYKMTARGGKVLYVGKATSLQRRVNSYFQKRRHDNTERTLELLTQVRDVQVIVTASALEAALLESDEIKRLAPPYNKALRGKRDAAWFSSVDGARASPFADDEHPVGPLPGPDSLEALGTLVDLLARSRFDAPTPASCRALHLPPSDRIDPEIFAAGLRLFVQRHDLATASPRTMAPLLRLGARLWRRSLAERENGCRPEPDDIDETEDDEEGLERPLDEEQVSLALESAVSRCARMVRRGHLLCALAESCVVFRPKGARSHLRRALVIERGRVTTAIDATGDLPVPEPPGGRRGWRQRQRALDSATYDRLRVLTTELKRLLAEGAPVLVRVGPPAPWGERALERRLRWI